MTLSFPVFKRGKGNGDQAASIKFETKTLFVKNLSFLTTEDTLRQYFETVRIVMRIV